MAAEDLEAKTLERRTVWAIGLEKAREWEKREEEK